ncbi:MAG: hypothetical protein CBB71_22640 [Rhodopirellula sp. TMED11]|nr:MAG: hypothetical protein CBB71_22640 [Rhodopirellula sp. TMED11]
MRYSRTHHHTLQAFRVALVWLRLACFLLLSLCGKTSMLTAEDSVPSAKDQAALNFFESKIRPVLIKHCYECHSAESDIVQGGLLLDTSSGIHQGGDSGSMIATGSPAESSLIAALKYDDVEMPPDQRLDDQVIAHFETWIRQGALVPEDTDGAASEATIDWDQARSFWAFQPPQRQSTPPIEDPDLRTWPSNSIDGFILAKLSEHQLTPSAAADRRTWLRRVSFDLIGLPPTDNDVTRFIDDTSPDAKQRAVDRLLASPQHAERWARLWLDVARYAEDQAHIVGNNDSLTYPNAYLYRDWVINALASDLPYDEFVRLQLAADLMDPDNQDQHPALGFIGLGPKYYRRGDPEVMAEEWEDRIDTVSRGLLGLTVACARCHDHKFDPIPTEDYYALAGVFASTDMFNRPLDKDSKSKKPADSLHVVREGKAKDLNVMIRGDVNRKGDIVPRGFLTVLGEQQRREFTHGSGRQELADAIVSQDNPLTARVIVNRVWHQLMGRPLVQTPSNFGALGSPPSHPRLLDDLARRFMDHGWSLKWLQREIVLSSTYGQGSAVDQANLQRDPDNQWLWRMSRRRLSIEAYRDAILSSSGQLQATIGGGSIDPLDSEANKRTIYAKISRLDLNPMLARFDFPDPNAHSAIRHQTNTPLQKLFLLNSEFLVSQSKQLADRVIASSDDDEQRIEFLYRQLFTRLPASQEREIAQQYLQASDNNWQAFAQVLLISNEMFIID